MCKVNENGKIEFGAKEWLTLAGIMLSTAALSTGAMLYVINLQISSAIAIHGIKPHGEVETRLTKLEANSIESRLNTQRLVRMEGDLTSLRSDVSSIKENIK